MVDRKLKAAKGAFDTSLDNGIDFFDTAEVYGSKVSVRKLITLRKLVYSETNLEISIFYSFPWVL